MGINKVVFGGETIVDLTTDTVTEDDVANGVSFHDSAGNKKTGNLTFRTIYIGTTTPDSSIGVEGDIYVVTGG